MTWKTQSKFRQRAEEPGIGGTMMSLAKLQHDGIGGRHASYLLELGHVTNVTIFLHETAASGWGSRWERERERVCVLGGSRLC